MSELLRGVRVVELAVLLNGDTVGMRLADMGADVIKVEAPPSGDYIRDINGVLAPRWSPTHLQVNRNKRSVALDLRSEMGLGAFWRLLDTADIFIDGLVAGATDRLGIGYENQRERKPGIVFVRYTGFGSTGPYRSLPSHGQMMDALAAAFPRVLGPDGLTRPPTERREGGQAGGEGTSAGAMHAALHAVAGLVQRDRNGMGCFIDVAASDAVVAQAWLTAAMALNRDRIIDPEHVPVLDSAGMTGAKYQYYECADHRIVLLCAIEHRFWESFCSLVGRPDLASRSNLDTPIDFGADPELRLELQSIFHRRTQEEWVALAIEHHIPLGPAPRDFFEMREDPHVVARRVVFEDTHPAVGAVTYTGEGALVAGQPFVIRLPAPSYGQNTAQVLAELGYRTDQIGQFLVAAGLEDSTGH